MTVLGFSGRECLLRFRIRGWRRAGAPAGHTTVDLALGKSFGESWSFSFNALNVANRGFLLDNSETFGSTHYAEPRQLFAQVRYRFRY